MRKKKPEEKVKGIKVYLQVKIINQLDDIAKSNNDTRSSTINKILHDYLKNKGYLK